MPEITIPHKTFQIDAATGKTPWQVLPRSRHDEYFDKLLVTLGPNPTGTGRLEVTTADPSKVEAENAAGAPMSPNDASIMPVPWTPGDVSAITGETVEAVTAYRFVCTSGDIIATSRIV